MKKIYSILVLFAVLSFIGCLNPTDPDPNSGSSDGLTHLSYYGAGLDSLNFLAGHTEVVFLNLCFNRLL